MAEFRVRPLVSVVVPTFNRLSYLREALKSVENQTFRDIELIVLDDGSTDGTVEFLAGFRPPFPFRYSLHNRRERSFLRNQGVFIALGEHVAFLDDDDLWREEKLERQVEFMQSERSLVLSYSDTEVVDGEGRILDGETAIRRRLHARQIRRKLTDARLARSCLMFTSSVMVKKDAFQRTGGFDPKIVLSEDLDLYMRLARAGGIGAVPGDPLVQYRLHGENSNPQALSMGVMAVCRKHLSMSPTVLSKGTVPWLWFQMARHSYYLGDVRFAWSALGRCLLKAPWIGATPDFISLTLRVCARALGLGRKRTIFA